MKATQKLRKFNSDNDKRSEYFYIELAKLQREKGSKNG